MEVKTRTLKSGLTNLRGTFVGFLYVLKKENYTPKGKRPKWHCRCTGLVDGKPCNKEIKVGHNSLINKTNPKKHCGCQREVTLGTKFPREYHTWWDAKNRCHNPDHPSYGSYGAKGITMCESWRACFENFFADMGPRPKEHSLDRVDPFGHYEPSNVRWADDKTQARNKKDTKWVTHPKTGKSIQAAALAEEMGMSYQKLRAQMIDSGEWQKPVARPKEADIK